MKRQRNKKHLVLTKSFCGLLAEKVASLASKEEVTIFDETNLEQLAIDIEKIRSQGRTRVYFFDVAIITAEKNLAYVADGINRSGSNPLRELAELSEKRFIDLGHLYVVPEGREGIIVFSLGARFKEARGTKGDLCGYLQHGAIVAHAMGFEVVAMVIAEKYLKKLAFYEIERLC